MRSIPGWDQYYLDICRLSPAAVRTQHPNRLRDRGADHESGPPVTTPSRVESGRRPERLERPAKYLWLEHAERNAICNAARAGTATEACTIYVEIMPCMDCARAIVQAASRRWWFLSAHDAVFQRILRPALRYVEVLFARPRPRAPRLDGLGTAAAHGLSAGCSPVLGGPLL